MTREDLTVMVVDTSARAHAVAAAYMHSPNVRRVIVPGNNFIPFQAPKEVILEPANIKDPQDIKRIALQHKPDLIDVCQDDALAAGVVDVLQEAGFNTFGPTQAASRIEWDKAFARKLMEDTGIPHPMYSVFSSPEEGLRAVETIYGNDPANLIFVKAAGLCAGKGAIPAQSLKEAQDAIKAMADFGEAGRTYLIEEGMVGIEASVYAFCDKGSVHKLVRPAQDFKRRDTGDLGPNTGGMGSVAPTGVVTSDMMRRIGDDIVVRAIDGLISYETPYVGVLYSGLMITDQGQTPKVVEFNARWGAPEAEVIVPGIQTPMDGIAQACLAGKLADLSIIEDHLTRVCIVGASRGYPDPKLVNQVKGKQIYGLEEAMQMPHIIVFGAGINVQDRRFYANGGRLFSLVAEGRNVKEARERALEAMVRIHIQGNNLQYRTDIGHHDLERHYRG